MTINTIKYALIMAIASVTFVYAYEYSKKQNKNEISDTQKAAIIEKDAKKVDSNNSDTISISKNETYRSSGGGNLLLD